MREDGRTDTDRTFGSTALRDDNCRRRQLINPATRKGLLVAAAVVIADQLTKVWAIAALDEGPINLIGETLRLRLTRNPGAAFSSFAGGGAAIAVIAIIAAIGIALYLPKVELGVDRLSLSLIMGGALGNVADRIFRGDGLLDGAVVDFIDLSFWPTFNVADSAISVGVALMLISAFFVAPRAHEIEARAAAVEEPTP